jgi:hypothetical protein
VRKGVPEVGESFWATHSLQRNLRKRGKKNIPLFGEIGLAEHFLVGRNVLGAVVALFHLLIKCEAVVVVVVVVVLVLAWEVLSTRAGKKKLSGGRDWSL